MPSTALEFVCAHVQDDGRTSAGILTARIVGEARVPIEIERKPPSHVAIVIEVERVGGASVVRARVDARRGGDAGQAPFTGSAPVAEQNEQVGGIDISIAIQVGRAVLGRLGAVAP